MLTVHKSSSRQGTHFKWPAKIQTYFIWHTHSTYVSKQVWRRVNWRCDLNIMYPSNITRSLVQLSQLSAIINKTTATTTTTTDKAVPGHSVTWQWQVQGADWLIEVLRSTWHKIGHFGDVLPSQSFGTVLKKNITQQKHTYTNKL